MAKGGGGGGSGKGGGNGNGGGKPNISPEFAANLRHYWRMGDSSGVNNADDLRNHGQPKFWMRHSGLTRAQMAAPMALRGGSRLGTGLDGVIVIQAVNPTTSGENVGKNFTVGAWVRPSGDYTVRRNIIGKYTSYAAVNFALYLEQTSGFPTLYFSKGGGASFPLVVGTTALSAKFPATLLVGTYDGVTMRLFENGKQVASLAETGTPDTNAAVIRNDPTLGGTEGWFVGEMCDLFIMNRALHQGQIMRLAAHGPTAFEIPDALFPPNSQEPPEAPAPPSGGSLGAGHGSLLGGVTTTGSSYIGGIVPGGGLPPGGYYHQPSS